MNNAHLIYTRITDRTRQRVYALSTPLQLADFTEARELMVSSTLNSENPSTHVLAITTEGVKREPMLIVDALNYEAAHDSEIDAFLLETLALCRKASTTATPREEQRVTQKPRERERFSLTRILRAALLS